MPSQLVNNDNVDFLCARDFTWEGVDYKMGDDFDQDIAIGRIELLVRTRRVIPVVDSSDVKPRHWHREVRVRADVENRLGVSRDVLTPLDQTPPEKVDKSGEDAEVTSLDSDTTDGLGYDPGGHSITEVLDYVEEHPDEALSVYTLEEQGKSRPRLLSKLDTILNKQTDPQEENNDD